MLVSVPGKSRDRPSDQTTYHHRQKLSEREKDKKRETKINITEIVLGERERERERGNKAG